ncbi:MAG: MBL fold metallo-hydrolase [Clostridiales bacterium]|jgi:hydroxyacylglutathione hydrolase|nr:MBL fold metallo-hydrolase [Clostridiales bacterium]
MRQYQLNTLVLGIVQTNCYILSNPISKEAIVFDPGDQAEKIEEYLSKHGLTCVGILLTHGHFDHIMAVEELAKRTGAKVYAQEEEKQLLEDPQLNASARVHHPCSVTADEFLQDQESLTLAGFLLRVIHTPGHTAGGACYYFPELEILFSGDTLFLESIGRSDLPTGDGAVLVASIRNKLMTLEDDIQVYPGHGETTTIGHEKEYNPYLN